MEQLLQNSLNPRNKIAQWNAFRAEVAKESSVRLHKFLKKGIWAYFLLLIFEGALRKWVFPGLATPLLIIRDPLAVILLLAAWKGNVFYGNVYIKIIVIVAILSIIFAIAFGHGNIPVSIYGARIFVIHFPLMFLIGRILTRKDVEAIGKAMLVIALPMTVLIALQFYSPQSSFVNRGLGGDVGGAGFSGALGYFRPPGTFSFTTGNVQFYSVVICFLLYFWMQPAYNNRLILIAVTIALLIAIPLSISRSLIFQAGLSILFLLVAIIKKPKYIFRLLLSAFAIAIAFLFLGKTEIVQTSLEALITRFDNASNIEGGISGTLVDRFLGGLVSAIGKSYDQPFFGSGIGMGTNVGSALLASGSRKFLIAEEEWGRLIGEQGAVLGLLVIVVRMIVVGRMTFSSFGLLREGNFLPWLLLSFGVLLIAQGQWAQPTTLGFSTLTGGLVIACFNR